MQTLTTARLRSTCIAIVASAMLLFARSGALAASPQDKMDRMDHMGHGAAMHISSPFMGVKANTGTVSHMKVNGRHILTLSDDFKIPDAPAPHWQIVDSRGNVYLLQRLAIKGDRVNKQITLPAYIRDIAKVQIWCAWAEVLLGEATFPSPLR